MIQSIPLLPEGRYKLEVMKNNQLIEVREDECHSWTRNAWNMFASTFILANASDSLFGTGYLSAKNTAGTVVYGSSIFQLRGDTGFSGLEDDFGYSGAGGSHTRGIVVGTSTSSENFDGHALGSIITSSSSGLYYNPSVSPSASWDSGTKRWTVAWVRAFNNMTTNVTYQIGEIGIYAGYRFITTGNNFMFCRDVISPTLSVPPQTLLTVTYYFITQFPE